MTASRAGLWTTAFHLCEAFLVLGVASPLGVVERHSDPGGYRGRFLYRPPEA